MPIESTFSELKHTAGPVLDQLSERLWGEQARAGDSERGTVGNLIQPAEAEVFAQVLRVYAANARPLPLAVLAGRLRENAPGSMPVESAAFLVTGILALGVSGMLRVDSRADLLDPLIQGAFGLDDLSRELRELTLTGLRGWPEFPDGNIPFPPIGEGCLDGIRSAARRAGAFIASATRPAAIGSVDANGITSLDPSQGSADDIVRIRGNFPPLQPAGRIVLFPRANGGSLLAALTGIGWSQSLIEVMVPEPPGDGPVGFANTSNTVTGGDPTALLEFAEAVAGCLGPYSAGIAGRLNHVQPGTVLMPRQTIPTLAGNANVFHGGPVLSKVSATGGAEPNPPFTITGLNLRNGDTVYLENAACPTTFVDSTHLAFRIPAIPSGHKLLRIGRGYHRSNETGFEIRATLNTSLPSGRRLMPDSYVTLTGTGFGSAITATVDGQPAQTFVTDTHTVDVRITRPSRAPVIEEKRGEPVTIEIFDRFSSIGKIQVLVATFRIATFGDSIVWGQGLPPAQRFSMLVAEIINARRNGRIAVFAVDHCAHSGAVILPPSGEGLNTSIPRLPSDFTGECPNRSASITGQVTAWPVRFASELTEIDLVILDGGINDVDVTNILDPVASDSALAALTTARCGTAMTALLTTVLGTFPMATVIVTGYYPIVSMQSNLAFLMLLLTALGLFVPIAYGPIEAAIAQAWLHERLAVRSIIFATVANAALASAVATAAATFPSRRIGLAVPAFGAANAIFGPDPFVFGITPPMNAEDPVVAGRAAACGTASAITNIASIGHPNIKGAQAYANAIASILPSLGL